MENIKTGLVELFDEMLPEVKNFKRGSYERVFQFYFEKYRYLISDILACCKQLSSDEKIAFFDEVSNYLSKHAFEKMNSASQLKNGQAELDYNMVMAVYVIPILTYTREKECEELVKHMADAWNAQKISPLQLGISNYEKIASGFRNSIFDFFKRA